MENNYKVIVKNFFKENKDFKNRVFLIDANDEIFLDKNDKKSINTGVYFKIFISKKSNDLDIELSFFALDEKLNPVPIEKSIWSQDSFRKEKYISKIRLHYKKTIRNFLQIFNNLENNCQLKELINQMENPKYIFHYKLINTFSQEILEKIFLTHFENYPILNMSKLKNHIFQDDFSTLFIPKYIKNFYMNNLIVSVNSKKMILQLLKIFMMEQLQKKSF
ncbi:hypothetical protein [Aliarcobacter butzleri]|uniref:hypothetical protein n=1 Tax=Aliarcobacter butzleri TaxID=28197 RepID=UPI0021B6AB9D|nr:hypothetical protein [Aliarcobacter butzleri]MCT7644588.1 hypothetical protein [Aliarcobacter butzleri]